MEVLAGARDPALRRDARALVTSVEWVPVDAVADVEGAALVYADCRPADAAVTAPTSC
jgi:hypothetical protein